MRVKYCSNVKRTKWRTSNGMNRKEKLENVLFTSKIDENNTWTSLFVHCSLLSCSYLCTSQEDRYIKS